MATATATATAAATVTATEWRYPSLERRMTSLGACLERTNATLNRLRRSNIDRAVASGAGAHARYYEVMGPAIYGNMAHANINGADKNYRNKNLTNDVMIA